MVHDNYYGLYNVCVYAMLHQHYGWSELEPRTRC